MKRGPRTEPGRLQSFEIGVIRRINIGTSLVVQQLRLHISSAQGAGLIPGWGTEIAHDEQLEEKKKKNSTGRNSKRATSKVEGHRSGWIPEATRRQETGVGVRVRVGRAAKPLEGDRYHGMKATSPALAPGTSYHPKTHTYITPSSMKIKPMTLGLANGAEKICSLVQMSAEMLLGCGKAVCLVW